MSARERAAGSEPRVLSVEAALAQVTTLLDGRRARQPPLGTWSPFAARVPGLSGGAFVGGGWKITHHTTEGRTAAGAISAFRGSGSWPHFTAEWRNGSLRLFQHLPLEVSARALINPPDRWETNRARTIQIEWVGFAAETGRWSAARYAAMGRLCRWIESRTGCPRAITRGVSFPDPHRLSGEAFQVRSGHNGHVHVPGNDHTDPGRGFRIGAVLREVATPHRTFRAGTQGPDVVAFQKAVNARARACGRQDRLVDVDGIVGPQTLENGAWAAWILGVGRHKGEIRRHGISARVQRFVRNPRTLDATQKRHGRARRRRHCHAPQRKVRAGGRERRA